MPKSPRKIQCANPRCDSRTGIQEPAFEIILTAYDDRSTQVDPDSADPDLFECLYCGWTAENKPERPMFFDEKFQKLCNQGRSDQQIASILLKEDDGDTLMVKLMRGLRVQNTHLNREISAVRRRAAKFAEALAPLPCICPDHGEGPSCTTCQARALLKNG